MLSFKHMPIIVCIQIKQIDELKEVVEFRHMLALLPKLIGSHIDRNILGNLLLGSSFSFTCLTDIS